ncbi:hypothetical protein BGX34_003092 [Mortierella sp. NVP85]|nr:hypothetical protein BGX34_003092 [Mortierella sp. NVP85]
MSLRKPFALGASHWRVAIWILLTIWSLHLVVLASPIPQDSGTGGNVVNGTSVKNDTSSFPANDTSLVDPFSTPDYLAPSKFTWANCVYGMLFIIFGLIEVVQGYKYIRLTMLVTGFFVWGSLAVMIMLIADINSGGYQTSGAYFAVWFILGLIGALVSFYFWHIGIILTGAWGMFVVVAVILTAINLRSVILRFSILGVCLVLGGYLTYRFERVSVILATSLGGAYSFMFGLDMFIQTGFRATFHVILSQSTARFHPNVGTYVMIALTPLIALAGVIWELKHHDEPVGGWWFGHGARPEDGNSPPSPDAAKKRRCCGLVMSKPLPKKEPEGKPLPKIVVLPSKKERRCCMPLCCGRREDKVVKPSPPPPRPPPPPVVAVPPPATTRKATIHKETIGRMEHHKVVIQKSTRDFFVDINERR